MPLNNYIVLEWDRAAFLRVFPNALLIICLSFEFAYINCLGLSGSALLNQQYTTNKYARNYLQPITCVCPYFSYHVILHSTVYARRF